jgi:ABC-type transporter MlaC component
VRHPSDLIALSLIILALALGDASAAAAQPAGIAKAATEPIMRQLEAFRRGDYDAAYVFASAEIKQMFDRRAFERMVKDGYPEIARSFFALVSRADVGPDGRVYVHVRVKGANGVGIEALYEMVRERGAWKINSVMTRPDPGLVLAPLVSRERAA